MQPEETQPATQAHELSTDNANPRPAPDLPVANSQSNTFKRVFRGADGLRAFWRFLIFLAILVPLQFLVGYLFFPHRKIAATVFTPGTVVLWDGLRFLGVLAAAGVMAYFEKRSLGDYGLPIRGAFGNRFWEGALWGVLSQCGVMLTLYATGNASFHGLYQHGSTALYFGLTWGAAFVVVGLFEEFLFRGYPQFTLTKGMGFWPAALVLAGVFWLAHMSNPGETWIGGLETALAALIFAASLWLTGDLWFAVGLHATWDWAETYLFGVADSGMPPGGHLINTSFSGSRWMTGGTVGPEGSVVSLVVSLLVIVLLFVRFGRGRRHLEEPLDRPTAFKPAA